MTAYGVRRGVWTAALLAACGAVGGLVALVSPTLTTLLILLQAGLLIVPVWLRFAKGDGSWLEPLVWVNGTLFVMFVVRPTALLAFGQETYKNYEIGSAFDSTLTISIAGTAAFCLGYCRPYAGILAKQLRPIPDDSDDGTVVFLSVTLIIIGALGYAVFAAKAGLSPQAVFSQGLAADPDASSAYLYLAPFVSLPAGMLLFRSGQRLRRPALVAVALSVAFLMVNILAPAGDRFSTLLFLASFAIYPALRTSWRPSPIAVLVTVMLALVFITATQINPGEKTNPVKAIGTTVGHPSDSARALLLGPTIEMFDALAVEQESVRSDIGYHPGSVVGSLVSAPVPRQIWPGKPYPAEGRLNAYLFESEGVRVNDASVAYSILGGFYYDSGVIGVMLGLAILGLLLRALYEYSRAHRENDLVQVLYAVSLPLIVLLCRGNLPDTLSRAVFVVAPIPIVAILARRSSLGSHGAKGEAPVRNFISEPRHR